MMRLAKELVSFLVGLMECVLLARFMLKFLGASTQSPIVSWLYSISQPLVNPFILAFPTPSVQGSMVLEFSTLFAIATFAFFGYLVQELLGMIELHSTSLEQRPTFPQLRSTAKKRKV